MNDTRDDFPAVVEVEAAIKGAGLPVAPDADGGPTLASEEAAALAAAEARGTAPHGDICTARQIIDKWGAGEWSDLDAANAFARLVGDTEESGVSLGARDPDTYELIGRLVLDVQARALLRLAGVL